MRLGRLPGGAAVPRMLAGGEEGRTEEEGWPRRGEPRSGQEGQRRGGGGTKG